MYLIAVVSTGCSTLNKSVMTGVGIGGAAGAVVGSNTSGGKNKSKSAAIGAVTGAVISGIAGYFIHKGIEKRDEDVRRETLFNLDKYDVSTPSGFRTSSAHGLTAPRIESEWVPTRVEGKRLIEGHKIWVISDEARWVPNAGMKKKRSKK